MLVGLGLAAVLFSPRAAPPHCVALPGGGGPGADAGRWATPRQTQLPAWHGPETPRATDTRPAGQRPAHKLAPGPWHGAPAGSPASQHGLG